MEAAALDRSTYQWTYTPDGVEQMTDYVRDALAKVASQAHVAFATVRRGAGPGGSDLVVGATRFCELAFWQWPPGASHQRHGVPDVVDIGYTWLAGPAQRTHVNTEAKLLMMTHAFEVWEVHRVALQTDVRNKRSRAAIERIGGQLDGIMRADRPGSDDTVRTSARFSIVAAEWPDVKARLTARLPHRRSTPSAPLRTGGTRRAAQEQRVRGEQRSLPARVGCRRARALTKKTTSLTRRSPPYRAGRGTPSANHESPHARGQQRRCHTQEPRHPPSVDAGGRR